MTRTASIGLLCLAVAACGRNSAGRQPDGVTWSAWVEDAAVQRGYVKPGDIAQFGCPPGWMGVDDTAAALRDRHVSLSHVGVGPPRAEGTITCLAQGEFALPARSATGNTRPEPARRPLAPVWLSADDDGITIGFTKDLPLSAPVYIGQDTPCGPRLIGVELGDLLKWLADPTFGQKRHFLGMISGGCPELNRR